MLFDVGKSCPYFKEYKVAKLTRKNGDVTFYGPYNEPYKRQFSRVELGNYEGKFVNTMYKGSKMNDWHFVKLESTSEFGFKWTNKAGVSWDLTLR